MTKKQFIADVIDEVTVGGLLPLNIPLKRVNKLVDKAVKKFRDYDNRATTEEIILIEVSGALGNCKIIKLASDVKAVQRLEHTSSRARGGEGFSEYGGEYDGRNSSGGYHYDIVYRVASEAYSTFIRQNSVRFMPYDFSEYTHELTLEATPQRNLFAELAVYIPPEALYDIEDVQTWCESLLTIDFVKANNFIKTKLIGDREIDFDTLKTEAKENIKKIEQMWKDEQSNGVMLLD